MTPTTLFCIVMAISASVYSAPQEFAIYTNFEFTADGGVGKADIGYTVHISSYRDANNGFPADGVVTGTEMGTTGNLDAPIVAGFAPALGISPNRGCSPGCFRDARGSCRASIASRRC